MKATNSKSNRATMVHLSNENEEESQQTQVPNSIYSKSTIVDQVANKLRNGCDLSARIDAAREVGRMVRKSSSSASKAGLRCRLSDAGVIEPLVSMLHSCFPFEAREAALVALLNVAARNQRNKIRIVTCGAVPPLVELLKSQTGNLKELATAAILSLSSVPSNRPAIVSSGAASLLVQVLCAGNVQARVDAVTALCNLTTHEYDSKLVLDPKAVPPLVSLLNECNKYSKFADKTTFLLENLSNTEEGRSRIMNVDGGILALVETVENGSPVSMLHAVGALLSLCKGSRDKYRDLILREGAIPGLLRLTAEGTEVARDKARTLLDLLRDSPPRNQLSSSMLERIVYDFAAQVDGPDKAVETAKRLFEEMVCKSVELSLSTPSCTKSQFT